MSLSGDDIDLIVADIEAQMDTGGLVLDGSTLAGQVDVIAPRLHSEMQVQLRRVYGDLPSPLPDDLRHLMTTGVMAELMMIGYVHSPDDEIDWPQEWRGRFERGLAALAAGVDEIDSATRRPRTATATSEPRRMTGEALGRVFG